MANPNYSKVQQPHINVIASERKVQKITLSCLSIEVQSDIPFDLCFPNIGFITLNFLNGENLMIKVDHYQSEETNGSPIYINGLLSKKPSKANFCGKGNLNIAKIHPVVGYHFLKENMTEVTNQHLLLREVLANKSNFVRSLRKEEKNRTFDGKWMDELFMHNLSDWNIVKQDRIYHVVNRIIKSRGKVKISQLADEFCMSERSLNRQFLMKVGISPKAYAKIWRWQHVSEILNQSPSVNLNDIAYLAGYYDIPHLLHDFQERFNVTPYQFQELITYLIDDYLDN
ncbi:helix-turn-helix domain-containing protein [Catalinimonas sp. 4WD22]|uniref:helix-turn-helix domain-containing protein n=1 Tax=Catalinimonas locisalis TaxID=3133978 RepID=UPI0031010062